MRKKDGTVLPCYEKERERERKLEKENRHIDRHKEKKKDCFNVFVHVGRSPYVCF